MSENSPNSDPKSKFAALFKRHVEGGTGNKGTRWDYRQFANALFKAGFKALDEDTFVSWMDTNAPKMPQPKRKDAILNIFFADCANAGSRVERAEMERAWQLGQDSTRNKNSLPEPPSAATSDWLIQNPEPIVGLAALTLHKPRLGNEAGTYYIDATLKLGTGEFDYDGRTVLISLRDALLSIISPSYPLVMDTLIGDRTPHEHCTPIAGGVSVTGPKNERGQLSGNVFGGDHVQVVDSNGHGNKPITLALAAFRRSFDVLPGDNQGKPAADRLDTEARDAVLNALIFSLLPKDKQQRVILQKANMRRKSAS